MLDKTIAYHLEQQRQNQHVLEADGNIFSDQHRRDARKALDLHNSILAELDNAHPALEPTPSLQVLVAMHDERVQRIRRLDRMEDAAGPGISRDLMLQDIRKMEPERDALEIAIQALGEIAARPAVTHLKRGSNYDEYGRGILQTETPLKDNAAIVLYRDRASGKWFARAPDEFDDGRFQAFDPVSGDIVTALIEPREVLILIEGLDDRKWAFTSEEIEQIELGQPFRFSSDMTDDEDIWGLYKPIESTYDAQGMVSLRLRLL